MGRGRTKDVTTKYAATDIETVGYAGSGLVAVFDMKVGGGSRSSPYELIRINLAGGSTLIFGQASQTPFGSLSRSQRRQAGQAVAKALGRTGAC
jgi:hypothetical protein